MIICVMTHSLTDIAYSSQCVSLSALAPVCAATPATALQNMYIRSMYSLLDVNSRCRQRCGSDYLVPLQLQPRYLDMSDAEALLTARDFEYNAACAVQQRCMVACVSETGAHVPSKFQEINDPRADPLQGSDLAEFRKMAVMSACVLRMSDNAQVVGTAPYGQHVLAHPGVLGPNIIQYSVLSMLTGPEASVDDTVAREYSELV